MADKEFKTRIALLYRTYEEYLAKQDNVPLKGEVCIVEIPQSTGAVKQEPAVLIKVGDGINPWQNIAWTSAKAADVYNWAKKENLAWDDLSVEFKSKLSEYISTGIEAKVDKEMTGSNGTARIFNEEDGGGAKFEHVDGTESFVGVNDGGADGIAAQIYADKLVDGKWQGAKLDISNNGIYYTVGNKSAAERMIEDNELVVKKDIKDIAGGMHFIGVTEAADGETVDHAAERIYTEKGKQYEDKAAGDIIILKTVDTDIEYIYDGTAWIELGNQGLYATKAELEAEIEARTDEDAILHTDIDRVESERKLEILPVSVYGFDTNLRVNQQVDGSALVDKVIEATNVDKKQVVIKSGDYKYNVISIVNDETLGIKGFCVETMSIPMTSLEDKPALEKGIFIYNPAIGKTCTFYDKDFTSAEIESYVGEIVSNLNSEVIRAKAAEQELATKKLDVLPLVDDPDDPGYGWEYHIPYGFEFGATSDTINITIKTLTLDNKFTKMNFTNALPGATAVTAGLMTASDKVALDTAVTELSGLHKVAKTGKIEDLDQTDIIILDCNY